MEECPVEWRVESDSPLGCHIVLLTPEFAAGSPLGLPVSERHAKKGTVTPFFRNGDGVRLWLTAGIGPEGEVQPEHIRQAMGEAGRMAVKEGWEEVAVHLPELPLPADALGRAVVEGLVLGTYRFDRYRSDPQTQRLRRVDVLRGTRESESLFAGIRRGEADAAGTCLARDLANEPANHLRPDLLASRVQEHFSGTPVEVSVYGGVKLERMDLQGLTAVGKGSRYGPRLIEMHYTGDSSKPLIALVGKGVTFDSGGISLKTQRDISDMRMDMAGAAAVIGALDVIAKLRLPVHVVGLVPAAENLPGAHSMLPGDIIRYANGTTVQVANTDAEGRLILADGLILAGKRGARTVIDIATLTGACAAALGPKIAGVFGDEGLRKLLQEVGEEVGDRVWPMPLVEEYESLLDSDYADLKNISEGPYAGAITAALFLKRFVPTGVAWAHIDMAGPMDTPKTKGYLPAGATGFGVRLLAEAVNRLASA